MNQEQIDAIFLKGQLAAEKYKEDKINREFSILQNKIRYHHKIESYLQNFDITNKKIGDSLFTVYGNFDNNTILKKFFREHFEVFDALKTTRRECWYIVKRQDKTNTIIIFYGNELQTFEKAVIQRNLYTKGIPHIIEGRIIGAITKQVITEIMLKIDREYGKILLRIYNNSNE